MKTGFIGLGNLGIAIAENLLASQQPLYVYNRTASKAQPLIEKGAIICSSVQELAAQCDVVFTIVSDDAALNHITMGEDGIAAHLRKGSIHVSLSTILPATSEALHQLHAQHGKAVQQLSRDHCYGSHRGDMNLVLQQASTVHANMPVGHQVQSLLQQSLAAGLGEHDITVVAKTISESSKA